MQNAFEPPVVLYTDAPELAALLFAPQRDPFDGFDVSGDPQQIERLASALLAGSRVETLRVRASGQWNTAVVAKRAPSSHYARLIELLRNRTHLPHGLVCVAGSGRGFQGFRGRSWTAVEGNIHISVHLAPNRWIEHFESVFMALAALAAVEAIDSVRGLRYRAGIRWVNDVVIDGAKVGGVLAYTQTLGSMVTSVVLGIGLNVESTPRVPATAFVPRVAALRDFVDEPEAAALGPMTGRLLDSLSRNYALLMAEGAAPILEAYRRRSLVLGRQALFSSDDPDEVPRIFASGCVESIGDGLELRLHGREDPIRSGRMILREDAAAVPVATAFEHPAIWMESSS